MKKSIEVSNDKTIKLTNVLIREIQEDEMIDYIKMVDLMEAYIKSKGATPIGPLVQLSTVTVEEDGTIQMNVKLLRQSSNFIHKVDMPYKMESIIRAKNCMYARFVGEESKLKFAYDKLSVTAYEEDIPLTGTSYTVFVGNEEDNMIVDVFMEKRKDE